MTRCDGTARAVGGAVLGLVLAFAAAAEDGAVPRPVGDFVAIALRSASSVASPLSAVPAHEVAYLGRRLSFGDGLIWFDGSECENLRLVAMEYDALDLDDPLLSDVRIGANDGVSVGDRRLDRSMEIWCGDDRRMDLVMIDRRVLVATAANSSMHLILEKPLTRVQVARLQTQLKDMKFYHGEITGEMDAEMRRHLGPYSEYRGALYRFANPAITENFLDGLGILDENGE